jgi:4-hydroxyphenylpyruvate dioxygenase-like putative hemolysin
LNKINQDKLPFEKFDHVGVLVRDLDKAIEYYQSLGIGPFEKRTIDALADKTMYGKPAHFKLKMATAPLGPIKIEIIEPSDGAILQQEFLENKGEGINHIAFAVDDLEKEKAKLMMKGLKVILTIKLPNGAECAYFDARQVGGVIIELVKKAQTA